MNLTLLSLQEAKQELVKLSQRQELNSPNWSPYKVFVHCAKTIEYSITGYPVMKPKIVRLTIGKLVVKKFLKQGFMKHDLMADVPGSPSIVDEKSWKEGLEFLIKSIDKFSAYNEKLRPHLIFGDLSKGEYDKYFAIHIADHLSEID